MTASAREWATTAAIMQLHRSPAPLLQFFRVELEAGEEPRFYAPAGWRIREAPPMPALHGDPAVELTRRHWEGGIEIDKWTGYPRWGGEKLDLGEAIDGLWSPRATTENVPAVTSAPDPECHH